ncbi:MAG: tripartite tricarboxylate transporter TctB family protein [Alphaproteobacteria bacterium]
MSDRLLGVAGLGLVGLIIWRAGFIRESFIQDPLGPKAFPYVIAVVIGLTSLAVIARPSSMPQWPDFRRFLTLLATVVVLIIYAEALPRIGFVVSTACAATFLSWQLGARILGAGIAGVLISVGIYVLFQLVLGLSLARGPWGF